MSQPSVCRLSVFTFLWACQALVHQEFFPEWIRTTSPLGWLLTVCATAALLWPRSLILLCAMLVSSMAYNIGLWPFVVNHILVETVVNLTILLAIAWTVLSRRRERAHEHGTLRDDIFDRFAPVVRAAVVAVYGFAFLSKLNGDFFDLEVSCVSTMFGDLVRRVPFLPQEQWSRVIALGATLAIEASIPILLTFRSTRWLGIAIGLPFHFVLGLIGHRTFSALAYAVYALFCMEPLTRWLTDIRERVAARWSAKNIELSLNASRVMFVGLLVFVVGPDLIENRSGLRATWIFWISWSLTVASAYFATFVSTWSTPGYRQTTVPHVRPGLLWLALPIVIFNGSTQYLGLKTQTNFTMYSNLRTETENNHFFMPALRAATYLDDRVQIIDTDLPTLETYVDKELALTYFEFRRATSESNEDFHVVYERNGSSHRFEVRNGVATDHALRQHPLWLGKLLYFRPVEMAQRTRCRH